MCSGTSQPRRYSAARVYYEDRWLIGAVEHRSDTPDGWIDWVRFCHDGRLVIRHFRGGDITRLPGDLITLEELLDECGCG